VWAWFVHHTPEFWTDSPHNFQIILEGEIQPLSPSNENNIIPIGLPIPPSDQLIQNEYTITPPPPFSLNDLLSGEIKTLLGVVYNGSFDTVYEREAMSIATLTITNLTTAVWLNISSAIPSYPEMRYLSYPLSLTPSSARIQYFYFSHEIHSAPDFDQVIQVMVDLDSCVYSGSIELSSSIYTPGLEWLIMGLKNDISKKLIPNDVVIARTTVSDDIAIDCKIKVLEELHCVLGPGFFKRCDGTTKNSLKRKII